MPPAPSLPAYDELPVRLDLPPGSSWGVWGEYDVLGCLNLLTAERVRAGVACVVDGRAFPLDLELELPSPPLFGRPAFTHTVRWLQANTGHDDELSDWNTQSSSQWDGFRHIRHLTHGFYGGVADEEHGMQHWARRGIVGRAVLADVGRWRADQGRPLEPGTNDFIEPDDVLATLEAQHSPVETGDILLLRTGWVEWYRSLDQQGRDRLAAGSLAACGLRPGPATARLLWDLHVAAVAADNPAVEAWPPGAHLSKAEVDAIRADPERSPERFLHYSLLPLLGLPLGELWDLGPLAQACSADGRFACLLTSAPLNLEGGVASPPNAIALR